MQQVRQLVDYPGQHFMQAELAQGRGLVVRVLRLGHDYINSLLAPFTIGPGVEVKSEKIESPLPSGEYGLPLLLRVLEELKQGLQGHLDWTSEAGVHV